MRRRTALLAALLLALVGALASAAPQALGVGFVNTHTWSSYGSLKGQVAEGLGMTVFEGELYVCDYSNSRIDVFTTDGRYLRQWSVSGSPYDIAIDPVTATAYVSCGGVVNKYSLEGDLLGAFTASGSGDGQTQWATGVALDASRNIYVLDLPTGRIQVFSPTGAFLRTFGSYGTGDGQSTYACGLDVDSSGNVYLFDFDSQRVSKFANDGAFLRKWGTPGSGTGQFGTAMYLDVGPNDHVFVNDRANNRIQEFTPDGEYIRSITAPDYTSPIGITTGPDGTLYGSRNHEGAKLFRWDWDDTAPVLTDDYDGEWHSQPFTVHFSAKDDYTPAPWLRWTTAAPDWTDDGDVLVPAPATHSYDGFFSPMIGAGDAVSNWAYKTLHIKIDTRAPHSTVSGLPTGWTNQEVYARIDATDVGSGVHRTFFDLDGGGLTELADAGIVPITTPGVHTLQYFSQDNCVDVPNEEAAKSVQVLVDMMGPTVAPANNVVVRKGAKATFKYSLVDDLSPTCSVKLVIKKKTKIVKTFSLGTKDSTFMVPGHAYSKALTIGLPAGSYTWTLIATDLAKNKGSYAPKKLTVKP